MDTNLDPTIINLLFRNDQLTNVKVSSGRYSMFASFYNDYLSNRRSTPSEQFASSETICFSSSILLSLLFYFEYMYLLALIFFMIVKDLN